MTYDMYRNYLMARILVPFMKQIVRNFIFQTERLNGLTFWHGLRFITDKKPLEITAAIHSFNRFCYSNEGLTFYSFSQYVKIGRLQIGKHSVNHVANFVN